MTPRKTKARVTRRAKAKPNPILPPTHAMPPVKYVLEQIVIDHSNVDEGRRYCDYCDRELSSDVLETMHGIGCPIGEIVALSRKAMS